MSGCCGQGPVIVSGAPATPRVDVEGTTLCDVLPDGSIAGVTRVEAVFDTVSGDRVGTRTVDAVTGAPYTPTGTLQPCSTSSDCDSPTTPTATVGLCLADGTPIAVTVVRDCDGAVTSEGWINLTTGAWSAGAPPSGTVACGDSRSVQVSGTFCDVDDATGDVLGLVLIEYQYAADGTIAGVRLVDAVTGATYTPQGTVTTCPAGVEQPEQDVVQLCDMQADGTSVPMIRDYRRDETGAVVGHTDYTVDGAAYQPTGTVGPCPSPCRSSHTEVLCDSTPQDLPLTGTYLPLSEVPIDVGGATEIDPGPTLGQQLWDGQTVTIGPSTGAHDLTYVAGALAADCPGCGQGDDTVTITVSVTATLDGPTAGQGSTGGLELLNGTTSIGTAPLQASAAPGWTGTPTVTRTVPVADLLAGRIRVRLGAETSQAGPKSWTFTGFTATATRASAGCGQQFLRTYLRDCVTGETTDTLDTTLGGAPYVPTGDVASCVDYTCPDEPCAGTVQVLRLCDLDPDVTPDAQGRRCAVPFLRHLIHDCSGALVETRDTTMDGSTPYTPVAVVDCGSGGVPAQVELAWPQTGIAEDPAGIPRQDFIYTVTNPDTGDVAEIRLHATSTAGGGGCGGPYNPAAPVFNNPTTYTLTLDDAAQEMNVFRLDLVDFDTFEGVTGLTPPPSRVEGDVTWNGGSTVTANTNNVNAFLYWDTPPPQISYRYGNTGGGNACSAVAFQGFTLKAEGCCGCTENPDPPATCTKQTIERCGCDDTDGDGIGDVQYTELWAVDPCNGDPPVLLGTYEDGDLTKPYTPAAPVECTAADTLPSPLSTGIRNVTGTTVQDLAAEYPSLQSVSVSVLAGSVQVTMSDGTSVPVPAGVTLTWSVEQEADTALAAASFAGADTAARYLLNWTAR